LAKLVQMPEDKPLSPGEFIKVELQQRGWTQADFATIIRRHVPVINELLQGKRVLTPEIAVAIGIAFGTGPTIWLERENAYRLSLLELDDCEIQRRTRLYEMAPIKDMQKRQWIADTDNPAELEGELCRFFRIQSLDEEPHILASARQTSKADEFTAAQRAWAFRASHLAGNINARKFDRRQFNAKFIELRTFANSPERARHIPGWMAEQGVRLVVVESIPKTRIDGAALWLNEKEDSPVIVLSLRYDRIDAFWHTLVHEARHIANGDRLSIDSNLFGETKQPSTDQIETRADSEAADFLIPKDKLESFIIRTQPYFSKERIMQFAVRIGVHPGIVVGQLQHSGKILWKANREMLDKIRDYITTTAATDGFGKQFYETKSS
jgi:HTH-type transcriptional regulator / antitoxin HigA